MGADQSSDYVNVNINDSNWDPPHDMLKNNYNEDTPLQSSIRRITPTLPLRNRPCTREEFINEYLKIYNDNSYYFTVGNPHLAIRRSLSTNADIDFFIECIDSKVKDVDEMIKIYDKHSNLHKTNIDSLIGEYLNQYKGYVFHKSKLTCTGD